jgi:hypothetical protein
MTEPRAHPRAQYGPFHRLASPTQTRDDAERQVASGEVWGRQPRFSSWPQVQALRGLLPGDADGIEFYTDIRPDNSGPRREARWSGGNRRPDVRTEAGFAKISCVITEVRYGDEGPASSPR